MKPGEEPSFVNRSPGRCNAAAFPRVTNAVWARLLGMHLTAVQWQVLVCLMVMQRGVGRYQAAKDSGDGHEAFEEAGEDFCCDAVEVTSGLIASIIDRSVVVVRRELRELCRAGLVIVHERGYKGHTQVLSLQLDDPERWRPQALGERRDGRSSRQKQNRPVSQS